jgi:hypothetical protein
LGSIEVGLDVDEDNWFVEFDLGEGLGICNLSSTDIGATKVEAIVGSIEGRDVDG